MPFLVCDDVTAGWLSLAIRAGSQSLAARDANVPPDVLKVAAALHSVATGGQGRTFADVLDDTLQALSMDVLLLTYEEAARRISRSERTVRRLVKAGTLPTVKVGGTRLIRTVDLEKYVASLGSDDQDDDTPAAPAAGESRPGRAPAGDALPATTYTPPDLHVKTG